MSASKSTYLHGFSAFAIHFSFAGCPFFSHLEPIYVQKTDTYCRIFKKIFIFEAQKNRDAVMHPSHTSYLCDFIWLQPVSFRS